MIEHRPKQETLVKWIKESHTLICSGNNCDLYMEPINNKDTRFFRWYLITPEDTIRIFYTDTLQRTEEIKDWWNKAFNNDWDVPNNVLFKYANLHMHRDVYPYEIVGKKGGTILKIRAMDTKEIEFPKEFCPGGFPGHFADNISGQDYEYISNTNNPVREIRKSNHGYWKSEAGKHYLSDRPYKFYGYNF